jgi:hypothetical protein
MGLLGRSLCVVALAMVLLKLLRRIGIMTNKERLYANNTALTAVVGKAEKLPTRGLTA